MVCVDRLHVMFDRFIAGLTVVVALSLPAFSQTVTYYQTGEEFNGPFPSWKNVKTDYGAKGDGSTDDAAAINTAVRALKATMTSNFGVLYFPAGTYIIRSGVSNTGRSVGDDYSGMGIIGEDPATTVISWEGASGGTMLSLDGWYFKVSRLAFNGKSSTGAKAANGIMRQGSFGTGCEMSDLIITDCGNGLNLSSSNQGQAEHLIVRCKFIRCDYAVPAANYNSLDLWIWYSLFEDCGRGTWCGGYQVYNCVFLRSKTLDIAGNSWQPGAFVNNVSIGSADFFTRVEADPFLVQNNKIYNCAKTYATPAAGTYYANNCPWINNTQSSTAPATVELPATPPKVVRKIFEVTTASTIQSQIIAAASEPAGTKPVVHFPKGRYTVSSTIVVPGNKEMSLIGDGSGGYGTSIKGGTPAIRLLGPSRVTISDMDFEGNPAIYAEVTDTVGSRVRARLFNAQGLNATILSGTSVLIDSIEHSDLMFIGAGIQNCQSGVMVRGGNHLGAGLETEGQVAFLSGASSHGRGLWDVQNGGKLIGQGFWYEADITSTKHLVELTSNSKGNLSLAAMFWCHIPPDNMTVSIDNFNGVFATFANHYRTYQNPVGVKITGNGQNCNVLQGYTRFSDGGTTAQNWSDQTSPDANAAFLGNGGSNVWKKTVGAIPDTASLSKFFKLTKSLRIQKELPCDSGFTDLKFNRVVASCPAGGVAVRFVAKKPTVSVLNRSSIRKSLPKEKMAVISMGQSFRVPARATRMTAYAMDGRLIADKSLTNEQDINQATGQLASISKNSVVLVRFESNE